MKTDENIRIQKWGRWRLHLRGVLDPKAVIAAMDTPGEILKASPKSVTRRVGSWVIKETLPPSLMTVAKLSVFRERYRRGWRAALHLRQRHVCVPEPYAFVERRYCGMILGNAVITQHLSGFHNVEDHARELVRADASDGVVRGFLWGLADAVNELASAGAYHSDLSGKNIFTKDGASFYFIDLDGVRIGQRYGAEHRMKNHVQLYDSFCDLWPDDTLCPFLLRMLPRDMDSDAWLKMVHEHQARRRQRIEAIWKAQGQC